METNEIVLLLLRRELWGCEIDIPSDADWPAVYAELKSHSVVSLVDRVMMEYCPDQTLKRTWSMAILHRLNYNEQNLFGQDSVLTLLRENGIPAAILKGAAVARYYPRPKNRAFGDVDFLVPKDRFEEALALLKANGYHQRFEFDENACEVALEKDHVLFELHRGVNTPERIADDYVNKYVSEGLNHLEPCCIDGHTFSILPELTNGLVLLSHMRQHMKNRLGLRQIIDWMMYVHHSVDNVTWRDSFQKEAKQCGLEDLAVHVTRMCQMYLGLTEDITWCSSADETVCKALMDYIFESGNFGAKIDRDKRTTQRVMMKKNYMRKLLTSLQSKGRRRPIVKRYPVLRPVAWAVQLGFYINQTCRHKNVINTLRNDTVEVRQQRDMFEALGILE